MPYDSRSKDGKALLSWPRDPAVPRGANLFKQFKLDESWTATRTRSSSRSCRWWYAPIRVKAKAEKRFYSGVQARESLFARRPPKFPASIPDGTGTRGSSRGRRTVI